MVLRVSDMPASLRILGLILFIPCVTHGGPLAVVSGAAGVALLLARLGLSGWRRFSVMNRRLRWFYLSIVVLFGWFSPGRALLPEAGVFSPSVEGLLLGVGRVAILATVVGGIVWLLERTSREELVGGLLSLTAPLARLSFPRERFAVRLALVLETVPRVQPIVAEAREAASGPARQSWAERARQLMDQVIRQAETVPCEHLEIPEAQPPRPRHWLVLFACLAPLVALALWRPL